MLNYLFACHSRNDDFFYNPGNYDWPGDILDHSDPYPGTGSTTTTVVEESVPPRQESNDTVDDDRQAAQGSDSSSSVTTSLAGGTETGEGGNGGDVLQR